MDKTVTLKRVGNWILEWDSARPNTVWAIPEYLKTIVLVGHGILYHDGTMAWDNPYRVPAYVRNAASQFVLKCQARQVA